MTKKTVPHPRGARDLEPVVYVPAWLSEREPETPVAPLSPDARRRLAELLADVALKGGVK